MTPSVFPLFKAMTSSCRVLVSWYAMPVVVVPLPSAQLLPLNVTDTLKMFFPLGRGAVAPDAEHPSELGTLMTPLDEIVTGAF